MPVPRQPTLTNDPLPSPVNLLEGTKVARVDYRLQHRLQHPQEVALG